MKLFVLPLAVLFLAGCDDIDKLTGKDEPAATQEPHLMSTLHSDPSGEERMMSAVELVQLTDLTAKYRAAYAECARLEDALRAKGAALTIQLRDWTGRYTGCVKDAQISAHYTATIPNK